MKKTFLSVLINLVNLYRYVFTMEDMDTVAPCYEYFLEGLEWLRSQKHDLIDWVIEELPTDFEQYFTYERVRHLVLWKVNAKHKQPQNKKQNSPS